MLKLNEIIKSNKVTAYGFKAFVDYVTQSDNDGHEVVLSTLSPAIMQEMGISTYYAPVLPRGAVFNTAVEVRDADLDVNIVTVLTAPSPNDYSNVLIVSRHQGTIEIFKNMYPNAGIKTGNITAEDINNCCVVGTLPPHLIAACKAYQAVTIKDFDYAKDGDLIGDRLRERIEIHDTITVVIE